MKKYVVVERDEGFISCLGAYKSHTKAVEQAYFRASEICRDASCDEVSGYTISPIYVTEGDTGNGIDVFDEKHELVRHIYILSCEE